MEILAGTSQLLFELAVIILLATVFAYFAKVIKQPLIPAYIIAGIVLGPLVFGVVSDSALIKVMSEIGIMFLLFIVGLEMKLENLKKVGFVSSIAGILQVVITFAIGYVVANAFGFSPDNSIFLGLVAAFSSTMIVIKLLSDRNDIDTMHGRLLVGILLIQDIIVIAAMPFLSSLAGFSWIAAVKMLVGAAGLGVIAFIFSRFVLKPMISYAARSQELLFLISLSICFVFAMLAAVFGFSIAIGAFIAGLVMANLPYHFNIMGRVAPLKDFFSTIFFVSLGMQIVDIHLENIVWPLVALFVVIVLIKPIIVSIILALFGYGRRTSFVAGSLLAQISEFSLILIIAAGSFITEEVFSITMALALITITLTSYILKYDDRIYNYVAPFLGFLDSISLKHQQLEFHEKGMKKHIILMGCDRMGTIILRTLLEKLKKTIFVVDSNPEVISLLISKKMPCMYGDIANLEVLRRVDFRQARVVISTVPHVEDNMILLNYAKKQNKHITVIGTAENAHDAAELYAAKADYVIVPRVLSGEMLSSFLKKHFEDKRYMAKIREKHMAHINHLNSRPLI